MALKVFDISQDPICSNYFFKPISELFDKSFISTIPWERSTLHVNGKIEVNEKYRKSKEFNNIFVQRFDMKWYDFLRNNNLDVYNQSWTMLQYEKGSFFSKHTDRNGVCTALFFPYCEQNKKCEGGELIIYDKQNKKEIYEINKFDCNKIIIFDANTEHEVLPLISGVRYVFRTYLYKLNEIISYRFDDWGNYIYQKPSTLF